jgi:hypothetical protein
VHVPLLAGNQEIETVMIIQDILVIKNIDLGASGSAHRDMMAFEAPLSVENGTKVLMNGFIIKVALPDANGCQCVARRT